MSDRSQVPLDEEVLGTDLTPLTSQESSNAQGIGIGAGADAGAGAVEGPGAPLSCSTSTLTPFLCGIVGRWHERSVLRRKKYPKEGTCCPAPLDDWSELGGVR